MNNRGCLITGTRWIAPISWLEQPCVSACDAISTVDECSGCWTGSDALPARDDPDLIQIPHSAAPAGCDLSSVKFSFRLVEWAKVYAGLVLIGRDRALQNKEAAYRYTQSASRVLHISALEQTPVDRAAYNERGGGAILVACASDGFPPRRRLSWLSSYGGWAAISGKSQAARPR